MTHMGGNDSWGTCDCVHAPGFHVPECPLYPPNLIAALDRARKAAERAELVLVSGTVGPIPGVEPSMTVRFFGDDWRDLRDALGLLEPS